MRTACRSAAALIAAAASPVLSSTTNAVDHATDRVVTHPTIVVSASRAERTADEIPAHVTVITSDAIRDVGARSVPDALERLGGVYFRQYSTHPGQADISLRGFGENSHGRVLVLVDGRRLNNVDMSAVNWLHVPVNSIERIELIRGGQTALHGNHAVAGVVNIVTRRDLEKPITTLSVSAGSDDSYGAHLGRSGSLDETTRYTADAEWQRSGGYRDNSDHETLDLRGSVTAQALECLVVTAGIYHNRNDYGLPGSLSLAQMRQNRRQTFTPNDNVETLGYGGHLGFSADLGDEATLDLPLNAGRRDVTARMTSWNLLADNTLDNFSAAPKLTLPFDLFGLRHRLIVGVDLAYDTLDYHTYSITPPTPSVVADLGRWSSGGYLQHEIAVAEQLSLIVGGRLERCGYEAEIADLQPPQQYDGSTIHDRAAFDASLLYRPDAACKFYARVASLYRYPFLDEIASYTGWGAPGLNMALKPEAGYLYEIGAATRPMRDVTADLAVYRIEMEDEIAWDWMQNRNSNLDETRRHGVDTALTWSRAGVGLIAASYAYVDAQFTGGANQSRSVPLVPAHTLALRGEYELPADLTLMAGARLVGKQHLGGDTDNTSPRMDDYTVVHAGLRFKPEQVKGLQLLLDVDNLFDENYANMAFEGWGIPAYYPAAGRTWRLTAAYRF